MAAGVCRESLLRRRLSAPWLKGREALLKLTTETREHRGGSGTTWLKAEWSRMKDRGLIVMGSTNRIARALERKVGRTGAECDKRLQFGDERRMMRAREHHTLEGESFPTHPISRALYP
jgi:hypothetical protein